MIYDIRHLTSYSYESPVSFARCSLRLEPLSGDGQQLISHTVEIRPRPAARTVRRDFFGTHTESVVIEAAHRSLRIDSRSRVSVSRRALARNAPSPSWETIRDVAFEAASLGPASPVGYVFASSLVPVLAPVTAYAASSFPPGGGIVTGAVDLMHRIRHDFRYDPKATVISTPLREVFEKRHGVCQDFAHVMIAGLRGLGLPAAYVSGYLRTIPPPGQPRLQGADATHAWVSVWCGADIGWIGFDPTNDLLVENDHIILAIGRDFSDVSPVDGIIVGSRKQKLKSPWTCCWWSEDGTRMPGLVPGIHVLLHLSESVDGRDKPGHDEKASGPVLRGWSNVSARRLRKNASTSRDRVSAVAVSSLDAVRTEAAAVFVVPMASLSEPILTTRVPLPCAASCAFAEISRVAASCCPMAPAISMSPR